MPRVIESDFLTSDSFPLRLLAIDLDGTLLNDSKKVSAQTVRALHGLPERGVLVVIASARPPRSVRHIYNELKLVSLQINYNGALIWDEPARKAVYHRPLLAALVAEIVHFARGRFADIGVSLEVMDRWYTDRAEQPYTTETGRIFKPDVVTTTAECCSLDTTKLMLLAAPQVITEVLPMLLDQFGKRVIILQTDPHLLQIMDPRNGKAAALQKVVDGYGIDMNQVMAIGDAPNDVGMLQLAGVAVAMDNAHPAVKAVADWVAPSNNDHGVHAALVRYGLCDD